MFSSLTMSSATTSRVALAKIQALTFYKDSLTAARRTDPVPELTCIGTACSLYTPDVVRCVNVGGEGTEVDWKVCSMFTDEVNASQVTPQCEADLPEALRFGRVEVSCEGWSAAGDPFVLKGTSGKPLFAYLSSESPRKVLVRCNTAWWKYRGLFDAEKITKCLVAGQIGLVVSPPPTTPRTAD